MSIREREASIRARFSGNKLKTDESTYHFSTLDREQDFIKNQFPTRTELDAYRAYREEWHRRAESMETGDGPLAVIIELVSTCNLQCHMCYTITPEFQAEVVGAQRILPWDAVCRIIDECVRIGVCSVLFSWRGESMLYRSKGKDGKTRDFADVLAYARNKGILEITCLTNGRSMSERLIKRIVQAEPNWLSFSIDGLGQTYAKIRPALKREEAEPFDIAMRNLKAIVEERERQGKSRPQIRTNTIYPPIADDPEAYRQAMEEAGVGLVTVNELLDFRGASLPNAAIIKDWFCQYVFQRLVVSANGVIMPCPGAHNEELDVALGRYSGIEKKVVVRNGRCIEIDLPEMTLEDAWNCNKACSLREAHRKGSRTDIVTCRNCRHGAVKHGVTWIPEDWDMEHMDWVDRVWRNN
ncbi:radical SAM/SPASM domain-containing protein [Candidatus Parcubacteria bacterium]|nr:MAG: radical SAM/SPASM domain-containing protein [Candidatus Parcubacteria bacterium]